MKITVVDAHGSQNKSTASDLVFSIANCKGPRNVRMIYTPKGKQLQID